MRKNLILVLASISFTAASVNAGPALKALGTYHQLEAIRTGDLNHLNQAMIYNNFNRIEEDRKQRAEESRREEERRMEQLREDDRQAEIQRLKQQIQVQKPAVVQPAVVNQVVVAPALNREVAPQAVDLIPQHATSARKFNDPVQNYKKQGGTLFWEEGVCKQRLSDGTVQVVDGGEAVIIRVCRIKGGPADITASYEQYYKLQDAKHFSVVEHDTLSGARTCALVSPRSDMMNFDVICKDRVALRYPVKSVRLDTPEAKQALKTIVQKMGQYSLESKDTEFKSDREIFFNSTN